MRVNGVVLLTIVGCMSLANSQDYMVFNQQDFDIWEPDSETKTFQADQALLNFCENYDIILDNDVLDCSKIRLSPKLPYENSHEIRKREVEEPELEGSGDYHSVTTEAPNSDENVNQTDIFQDGLKADVLVRAPEVPVANATEDELIKEAVIEAQQAEENKVEALPNQDEEFVLKTEENQGEATNQKAAEEKEEKSDGEAAVVTEEKQEETPTNTEEHKAAEDIKGATEEKPANNVGTEAKEDIKPESEPKKEEKTETTPKVTEKEDLKEEQSGAAVQFKAPAVKDPSSVELADSDKSLAKMAANAKQSLTEKETENPETGESSSEVSRAGKDTTILVVLFAAVLVVGGGAFAYNYVQKKKQKSGNRKSTTNGQADVDPETGTELKPLVKGNGTTSEATEIKVYTDEKREVNA